MSVPQSYGDFRAALEVVLGRIEALGLTWKPTRFGEYLRVLDAAAELEYPRRASWDEKHQQLWEAAIQGRQLVQSADIWNVIVPSVLVSKLREVLQGPPFMSRVGDDRPRNTLLELTTASLLHRCGLSVSMTASKADVIATLPGQPAFAVECKRPGNAARLRTTIQNLKRQVQTRISDETPHGIAVIGMDRIIGLTAKGLSLSDSPQIGQLIHSEFARWFRVTEHILRLPHSQLAPSAPLLGLVLSGVVFEQSSGSPITITMLGVTNTGHPADPQTKYYIETFAPVFASRRFD